MEQKLSELYITGVREIQKQYPPKIDFGLVNGYTNQDLDGLLGEGSHLLLSQGTLFDRKGKLISEDDPGVKMVNMLNPEIKQRISEGKAQVLVVKNQGGIIFE